MEFSRSVRKARQIGLISLIDVMFFLLIFFMFSTSFIHSESLELLLPSAGKTTKSNDALKVYLESNGQITASGNNYTLVQFDEEMRRLFLLKPEQKILLLSDESVPVQQLVGVMDVVYRRGGTALSVVKWLKPAPVNEAQSGV